MHIIGQVTISLSSRPGSEFSQNPCKMTLPSPCPVSTLPSHLLFSYCDYLNWQHHLLELFQEDLHPGSLAWASIQLMLRLGVP